MKCFSALFLASAAIAGSALAQTTVDFSSFSQAGTGFNGLGNSVSVNFAPQVDLGFVSSGGSFGNLLGVWQDGSANHPVGGSTATSLMEYYGGSTTTMVDLGSPAFALNSIDLASWGVGETGTMTVTFNGIRLDGTTVSQSFVVANSGSATPALQRFTFGSGFSELASVSFQQGSFATSAAFQFDNVSVTPAAAAVPEPSALWLMGAGLLGVAAMRRGGQRLRSGWTQ